MQKREQFLESALEAIDAPDLASAIRIADSKTTDRHGLRSLLGFFAQNLASQARSMLPLAPEQAERLAARYGAVLTAMGDLEKNGQPALVLEAMVTRLRRA